MLAVRLVKTSMVASTALFALLVAFNNMVDYGSNYEFVRHVLSMDATFPGNALMARAVTSPAAWNGAFWTIILLESTTGVVLALAGAVALVHVAGNKHASTTQRSLAVVLACLGILICLTSLRRWQVVQQAMRRGEDLPPSRHPLLFSVAVALVGVAVVVLLLNGGSRL